MIRFKYDKVIGNFKVTKSQLETIESLNLDINGFRVENKTEKYFNFCESEYLILVKDNIKILPDGCLINDSINTNF